LVLSFPRFILNPADYLCFCIQVATRVAYGTALAKLGKNNPRVIGLDGDTKNSTFSIKLKVRCHATFAFGTTAII